MEEASQASLHEAGHKVVAENLGIYHDTTFRPDGLPDSVRTRPSTVFNTAVVAVAGPIAASGGSADGVCEQLSSGDVENVRALVQEQGQEGLNLAILHAMTLVKANWSYIVRQALDWDRQAGI